MRMGIGGGKMLKIITVIVFYITSLSLAVAQSSQTAGGMSDITILSVDIGHFDHGFKIIHIYENSRNQTKYPDKPERWQFALEPLLSTVPNATGGIEYKVFALDPMHKTVGKHTRVYARHRVKIPLTMISNGARDKALEIIYGIYPEAKCKVGLQNIDVLPLTKLALNIKDIENSGQPMNPQVRIHSKTQSFHTSPSAVFLSFDVTETDSSPDYELKHFLDFVPFMQIEAVTSFSVKSTAFNITSISTEKLKDTDLYAKLSGKGDAAYVSRDDLRKLSQAASSKLKAISIIEDRANFDTVLFNSLLEASKTVTADDAFFNDQRGKQTYNADDLKPSVITKQLNKLFTKETGKDQWNFATSAEAGGSFLDIIKADAKGSFSGSQLHEFLKEHNVEAETDGTLIVVKSIDLQQINISKFVEEGNIGMEYRNIERGSPKQDLPTTVFGQPVPEPHPMTALSALTADCKNAASLVIR